MTGVQTCALRSEEHTSELQSHDNLVCRLLLEKKVEHVMRKTGSAHEERTAMLTAASDLECPASRVDESVAGLPARVRGVGAVLFFFLKIGRPPRPPLFPPAPLFP